MCGTEGVEVHHQYPQKMANEENMIETEELTFNKNHKANLMNICKKCHNEITKNEPLKIKRLQSEQKKELSESKLSRPTRK